MILILRSLNGRTSEANTTSSIYQVQELGFENQEKKDSTFTCKTVTQIPLLECEALVAFHKEANFGKNHLNWLVINSPCQWVGVTCENGHVVKLILGEIELSGKYQVN